MLKMVDGTGIIGVDMICPLGISTPQPPNYDRVELEGAGMLVLPNSLDAPLERLELGGKTEQVQTTGAQLFDKNSVVNGAIIADGSVTDNAPLYVTSDYIPVKPSVMYACTETGSKRLKFFDIDKQPVQKINFEDANVERGGTFTTGETTRFIRLSLLREKLDSIMLNEGSKSISYEPYTGGKPSPSPEYPQEIKNSGKWNEETQKYEVDVKITGKNLFDSEKAKDKLKWTPCAFNANFAEIAVYVGTGSTVTASNNVKIDNPVYYYGVALKSSEDIKYFICYPGYPNSKDTHTFTATEDYIYVRCNKTSLNDVIGVCGGLQIEIGASRTDFESYKEQTLTITSDRPLTKWDRLVEQGGEIGWLYKSKVYDGFDGKNNRIELGNKVGNVRHFSVYFASTPNSVGNANSYCDKYIGVNVSWTKEKFGIFCDWNNGVKFFSAPNEKVTNLEEFKAWLIENPLKIAYETTNPEFIPLPQSEQNAIRALKTYYPTTVITVDGGELDPDIKVTYRKEI